MISRRLIPALLLQQNKLVKTQKFKNPRYVGDPLNTIRIFNEKEVDELIILDIDASRSGREPDYKLIEQLAGECFMPVSYGGGVKTLEHANKVFSLGIEKVCLQTAALENPRIIREIAGRFGSQSVMVSLDVKRDWLGRCCVYSSATRKLISRKWQDYLSDFIDAGAGEILLNSVDRDGTLAGPDVDLIATAGLKCSVPLISVGGISSLSDIKLAVASGASAVAAGAFFVFHGPHRAVLITYPKRSELEFLDF